MGADALDQYVPGDSALHTAAPVVKVVGTFTFVVCVAVCPQSRGERLFVLAALPLVAAAVARVPVRWVLARLAILAPFLLLAVLMLPFLPAQPGDLAWQVPGTPVRLSLTAGELLGSVLLKSTLCVASVALLLATTGFYRVLGALSLLRVPPLFVSLLCFMYRYLFVLWEEVQRMLRARDSRAPQERTLQRLRTAGCMAGSLFIRSYERAERVAQAMVSRGFDGSLRLAPQPTGSIPQWVAMAALGAYCLLTVGWR